MPHLVCHGKADDNKMKKIEYIVVLGLCFLLAGCGNVAENIPQDTRKEEAMQDDTLQKGALPEEVLQDMEAEGQKKSSEDSIAIPTKEEILAMRETVLAGMSEEESARLTENIKVANLTMEAAYLNDQLFDRLSDKESPYWLYFDQKGDIQLGWWYNRGIFSMEDIMKAEKITEEEFHERYTEPGIVYNPLDAASFIELFAELKSTVQNEALAADLQRLTDLAQLAQETHEMKYANELYKILHDMDYFLLRYGIEDVGKYTDDLGTVATYYGVLMVYGGKSSK